jgi:hypothetical protein
LTTLTQIRFSGPATSSENDVDNIWVEDLTFEADAQPMAISGKKLGVAGVRNRSAHKQILALPLTIFSETQVIDTENGDIEIDAPIEGYQGGEQSLKKTGAFALTLKQPCNYYGIITIEEGVLALEASGDLVDESPVTVAGEGVLRVLSGAPVLGDISGEGTVEVLGGSLTARSIVADTLSIGGSGKSLAVPEPSSLVLLAFAFLGAWGWLWKGLRNKDEYP